MAFGSPIFLFLFLPCLLLLFAAIPRRLQVAFLLCCSLFFYLWVEGRVLWVLLLIIAVTYGTGRAIASAKSTRKRKLLLGLGISVNLLVLLVLRYAGFFVENLNVLLGLFGLSPAARPSLPHPLGISFFTFLAISFLIDSARKKNRERPAFLSTSLYVSFFPTIMAGPITPFREMEPQLQSPSGRQFSFDEGVRRFIIGLGKKVLLADTLAKTAGAIFDIPGRDLTFAVSWLGISAYTLQIYFDFSGYTDMAVGLGRLLGFRFMENFRYPYASTSVHDFWTRWHKSLTRWLRDYVYLPLAYRISRAIKSDRWLGFKADSVIYCTATSLTMLICGFWHGASWTFIIWGGYHAGALLLERFVWGKRLKRAWRPARHLYAVLLIAVGWVLFRSTNLGQALSFLKAMAGLNHGNPRLYVPALYLDPEKLAALAVGILASTPLVPALAKQWGRWREKRKRLFSMILEKGLALAQFLFLVALFVLSSMYIANETFKPFIYFRF